MAHVTCGWLARVAHSPPPLPCIPVHALRRPSASPSAFLSTCLDLLPSLPAVPFHVSTPFLPPPRSFSHTSASPPPIYSILTCLTPALPSFPSYPCLRRPAGLRLERCRTARDGAQRGRAARPRADVHVGAARARGGAAVGRGAHPGVPAALQAPRNQVCRAGRLCGGRGAAARVVGDARGVAARRRPVAGHAAVAGAGRRAGGRGRPLQQGSLQDGKGPGAKQ
eukprot:296678-Chlamydomonas_euryale.AAC.2